MWENVRLTNMVFSDDWAKGLQMTESSDWDRVIDLQIGYKRRQLVFKTFGKLEWKEKRESIDEVRENVRRW